MTGYSIGVDLGGTNLRVAAVDVTGKLLDKIATRIEPRSSANAIVGDMVTSIDTLRNRLGTGALAGVGVGVAGFIDMARGVIASTANMPQFENYPVRAEIERRLSAPVVLENDANAAALGEKWIGAGRGVDDLILLTLGTGIGAGIVIGGKILHGTLGMAGEVGHMTISPFGYPCGCGNSGCLEKYASATAISVMGRLVGLGPEVTSEDVYHLALKGDDKARHIFRTVGEALGIAIASLINIFNFPLVLLSGGPIPAWDFFAPSLREQVERRSFTYRNSATRIEPATLGSEAGLYGAAYLPFLTPR